MQSKVRRPSPALIVAIVALVAALAGTAVALPGKNSVKGNDIAKNAVKSSDVKNDKLTGTDINESTLGTVPNAAKVDVLKPSQGKLTSGQTATLVQHGPLTLTVECGDADNDNNLDTTVFIASSTEGTVWSSWEDGANDLGPNTPKDEREATDPNWTESSGAYTYDGYEPVSATAANGQGIGAQVARAAEESSNTCWYWSDATILG